MDNESVLLLVLGVVLLLGLVWCISKNRESFLYTGQEEVFRPFDKPSQQQACQVLANDPDMRGSGLTIENCNRMPLTAFNNAMLQKFTCKKNMCGVTGAVQPDQRWCVRDCKRNAYASAIYDSANYTRPLRNEDDD